VHVAPRTLRDRARGDVKMGLRAVDTTERFRSALLAAALLVALGACSPSSPGADLPDAAAVPDDLRGETARTTDAGAPDVDLSTPDLPLLEETVPADLPSADLADAALPPDLEPELVDALTDLAPELLDLWPDLADSMPLPDGGSDATGPDDLEDLASDLPGELASEVLDAEWVEEVVMPPEQPAPACGQLPYEWLPADAVGHVVSWEEQPLYNLPPALIEAFVAEAGYKLTLPLTYTPRVFKLRYTTQDRGEVREATAMVGFPDLTAPETPPVESVPATLFLHGTTGYADKCAPSQDIEGAAAAVLPASAGFLAVAPDYLGLCGFGEPCGTDFHPYLVGEPTAIASLDALRAALELRETLLGDSVPQFDGRVVPWGASQGGHGALFVDRFAPYYAPEWEMPCVVSVVPPANLAGQALQALKGLGSAASMGMAFLMAAHLWYAPDAPLSGLFNPDGPQDYTEHIPATFPTTCNAKKLYDGASSLADVFSAEALAALESGQFQGLEPWGCFALENSLPTSSVPRLSTARILFVLGSEDELVAASVEHQSFLTLCEQGCAMEFVECAGLTHTDAALQSINIQLEWLFNCLADPLAQPEDACQITEPQGCAF
jgi:hypothetical protein